MPDDCEFFTDCNANLIPDECEPDCNENGVPDDCDIASGTSPDLDQNGTPDECKPDCNQNGIPDNIDLLFGASQDCDGNGVPDECEDCDGNGLADACDIINGVPDCNGNGVPDSCDITSGTSVDCDINDVPDECQSPAFASLFCFCDVSAPCGNTASSGGCANSTGNGALLAPCGTASVAADDLLLNATDLTPNQFGIFFMAAGTGSFPFGDGQRCAVGTTYRFSLHNSGPSGTVTGGPGLVAFSAAQFAEPGPIDPGETWNFQYWYRDALGPCGSSFNLTNAVAVTFAP
jgi:hypothetical protein